MQICNTVHFMDFDMYFLYYFAEINAYNIGSLYPVNHTTENLQENRLRVNEIMKVASVTLPAKSQNPPVYAIIAFSLPLKFK